MPSSTPDISVQVGRVRSPVPQPRGEHRQVALETLRRFLGLSLEVHDFRLLVFFFYLFLSFKGLAWELERGLSSEEPLPLFQITQVWLSVLTSDGSVLLVTPAPKDLTSSSGLLEQLHTCYTNTHACVHIHIHTN